MIMPNMDPKKCPMPVQDPDVRNKNFKEVALGYTYEMAVNEAKRCLNCKNKPCVSGCPVNIDIPAFIAKVADEDMEGAYAVLSASSALPAVCGRVCPQENQCEGKCVRGIKTESVGIGRLERFVADWHREHSTEKPAMPVPNGHRVAVIGSGPSGLTAAGDLAKLGYKVTVYEALHTAGGVLVYGIPEFRLPKDIVRQEIDGLKELGVEPTELAGVLITHEHSDHISGLTTLTKQLRLPVYASPGTGRQLCYRIAFLEELLRPVAPGEGFSVGGLAIESFPTSHDAAESVGYALSAGGRKAAVVTDLGYVTGAVLRGIRGADLLVAEANHDVEWVQSGPYPYHLKARILGDRGHLSNEAGAELAWTAVEGGARTVVLAHLSHENNTPARAHEVVRGVLERRGAAVGRDVALEVAPRSEKSRRYTV